MLVSKNSKKYITLGVLSVFLIVTLLSVGAGVIGGMSNSSPRKTVEDIYEYKSLAENTHWSIKEIEEQTKRFLRRAETQEEKAEIVQVLIDAMDNQRETMNERLRAFESELSEARINKLNLNNKNQAGRLSSRIAILLVEDIKDSNYIIHDLGDMYVVEKDFDYLLLTYGDYISPDVKVLLIANNREIQNSIFASGEVNIPLAFQRLKYLVENQDKFDTTLRPEDDDIDEDNMFAFMPHNEYADENYRTFLSYKDFYKNILFFSPGSSLINQEGIVEGSTIEKYKEIAEKEEWIKDILLELIDILERNEYLTTDNEELETFRENLSF